jgi:hypothetical protein
MFRVLETFQTQIYVYMYSFRNEGKKYLTCTYKTCGRKNKEQSLARKKWIQQTDCGMYARIYSSSNPKTKLEDYFNKNNYTGTRAILNYTTNYKTNAAHRCRPFLNREFAIILFKPFQRIIKRRSIKITTKKS